MKKDVYRLSRIMYIVEAALEYFISIAVGTIYLARITQAIGVSDTITGILSSFVSLGCGFQIFAIFLEHRRPVKYWVTTIHIISQTAFAFLYLVPLFNVSKTFKTTIFIILLLSAQIMHNIINAPKTNWYMSLVDDDKRGKFTANKEIVSLLGGMVYMYFLSSIMDYYKSINNMRMAFIVSSLGIFVLMILHSITLILSKEKPVDNIKKVNTVQHLKRLAKDKTLLKIILIAVLYKVAMFATTSFTGTYQLKELAFSATFSSSIVMIGSMLRVIFSRPMGKFADSHGFANMLIIGYSILALSYGINIFTCPSNGKIFFPLYLFLESIATAGCNSAMINLVYDYVEENERTSALALLNTFSGFAGFLTTLVLSPFITFIQSKNNMVFGVHIYAQQILTGVSFIITLILLLYIIKVIRKLKKKEGVQYDN